MESIQAVEFNAAINITSLSYSRTTQPLLINIACQLCVSNKPHDSHGHPLPLARRDQLQMQLSVPAQAQPWTPSCRGTKRKYRLESDTVVSSRNLLYSSSVISCWGSLSRNYPGMQRQTESSLWSPIVASDLPKRQGEDSCVRQPVPTSPSLEGDSGAGMGVIATGYLLITTESSEHFVNAAF